MASAPAAEDGHARDRPDDLLEQLQLLAAQLWQIEEHPRDIATRLRQAPHESHGQGITLEVDGNDRNAAGRLLGCRQGARPSREDDVHVETNEVDGKLG
jgi:hypothetical protein